MEPAHDSTPISFTSPRLALFTTASMQSSPEHSGMLTPPLYTSASVPFRWEEEPGKPRPSTALIPLPTTTTIDNKCLELPPARLFLEPSKITKTPSPTTVLQGPYSHVLRDSRPKFTSSSFRFFRERRQGSFDSTTSSPERVGQFSTSVALGKKLHKGRGGAALLGSSRRQKTPIRLGDNGSSDDSSSVSGGVKVGRTTRNGESFSSLSQPRSHFWSAVYEGFKQVIPWKSRKSKKGLV